MDTVDVLTIAVFCFVGGFVTAAAVGSWLERQRAPPKPLWHTWPRCDWCGGLYPPESSRVEGYCGTSCYEQRIFNRRETNGKPTVRTH